MKQLWLSVLLKDTSAASDQAGIQTHILTTPELESNALDRSATTLRYGVPWSSGLVHRMRVPMAVAMIWRCIWARHFTEKCLLVFS